jgi:hypothetical protein
MKGLRTEIEDYANLLEEFADDGLKYATPENAFARGKQESMRGTIKTLRDILNRTFVPGEEVPKE